MMSPLPVLEVSCAIVRITPDPAPSVPVGQIFHLVASVSGATFDRQRERDLSRCGVLEFRVLPHRGAALGALGLALLSARCGSRAPAGPSPADTPLELTLPLVIGDSATLAYGIWPFGVHGGGHAVDGHPGFDFEFRIGGRVLAAAGGIVDNLGPDGTSPGRFTMAIRHPSPAPGSDRFTFYTNLESVSPGIGVGTRLERGQPIGVAGSQPQGNFLFAMIHFGVADPIGASPGPEGAVRSPEDYFKGAARADLETIWNTAAYINEWCEPFMTNSRASGFPFQRTWTRESGDLAARLDVRCPTDQSPIEYTLLSADGRTLDSGTIRYNLQTRPLTADFISSTGATRRAAHDIVSGTMRLALGPAGGDRPRSLTGATVFTTR
jgi:hypothetical protein